MSTMPYNYSYHASTALSNSLASSLHKTKTLSKQHDKNSVALGTGKEVNTPYDDSIRYFKDAHLSEKANSLNNVLDNISTIVTTLNSVDSCLTSLSDLIDLASGIAEEALASSNILASITGEVIFNKPDMIISSIDSVNTGDILSIRTGQADTVTSSLTITKETTLKDLDIFNGENFTLQIGDNDWQSFEVTNENMTVDKFMQSIVEQIGSDKVSYSIHDGELTFSTQDKSPVIFGSHHFDKVTQQIDPTDTSPTVAGKLGLSTEHIIVLEEGENVRSFMKKINDLDGITAELDKNNHLRISSEFGDDLIVTDFYGKTADTLKLKGSCVNGVNKTKAQSEAYADVLEQINTMVEDCIFDGVNLLDGDTIRAVFNDSGTAYRRITGVKINTETLGLIPPENEWENSEDISASLNALTKASGILMQATNYFQRASAMVTSREDFLIDLSETFQSGADSLVSADLNEVSANLLAISTERSIANQVINITLENNANILSLFG